MKKAKTVLTIAAVLSVLLGASAVTFKPLVLLESRYGTPACVSLYGMGGLGGFFWVSNGMNSKIMPVNSSTMESLALRLAQIDLASLPALSPIDPRYGASDDDTLILESWTGGKQVRVERNYTDDKALANFAHELFEKAHTVHEYRCS